MLDFKEIDKNGDDFELLIRELLYNKGLEVYWGGKGPDGGKDLLCIERYQSYFKWFTRRWLVQCKHNAHSGKAVGKELETLWNNFRKKNYFVGEIEYQAMIQLVSYAIRKIAF